MKRSYTCIAFVGLFFSETRAFLAPTAGRLASQWHALYGSPLGKVDDPDSWVLQISDSLKRVHGKDLFKVMGVASVDKIHTNDRWCLLSHDTTTDDSPLYNYGNRAALEQFLYSEQDFVRLYSYETTPPELRAIRQRDYQTVIDKDFQIIPEATRWNRNQEYFLVKDLLFWNVFNKNGTRVGQAATFDREKIIASKQGELN
jgi:hypothetical protein